MRVFGKITAVGYALAVAAAVGFYFSVLGTFYTEFSLSGLLNLAFPSLLLLAAGVPAIWGAVRLVLVYFDGAPAGRFLWLCHTALLAAGLTVFLLLPAAKEASSSLPSFLCTLVTLTDRYYWGCSLYLPLLLQLCAAVASLPPLTQKKTEANT